MGLFDMMNISASALSAERQRAEVTSANLANAETTHTDSGGPYVRKEVVFSASNASPFRTVLNHLGGPGRLPAGSVQLTQVVNDTTPPVMRYEPGNPDADKQGLCGLSGHQPGLGDGGPDGRRPGLSTECFGSDGRETNDPAIDRHFEIFVNRERTMSNVTLGAIPNFYVPNTSPLDGGCRSGRRQFLVSVVECRARRRPIA